MKHFLRNFLQQWHVLGLAIGLCTFVVIGLFHPICIKCEYYFGTRCWWWFLVLGIAALVGSLFVEPIFPQTLLGVLAFSSFWTIKEIFETTRPVWPKGGFLTNPNRKKHKGDCTGYFTSLIIIGIFLLMKMWLNLHAFSSINNLCL